MATLTGAALIATGRVHSGIYTSSANLEEPAVETGLLSGSLVTPWSTPELFRKEFTSCRRRGIREDRMNAQSSCAGRFVANHLPSDAPPWIHVDIAGPATDHNTTAPAMVDLLTTRIRSTRPVAHLFQQSTMPRGTFFSDFEVGHTYTSQGRTITEADVVLFAGLSGDFNPLHTDKTLGKPLWTTSRPWHVGVFHLHWAGPDPRNFEGTTLALVEQTFQYKAPVFFGDTVRVRLTVRSTKASSKGKRSRCVSERHSEARRQHGGLALDGSLSTPKIALSSRSQLATVQTPVLAKQRISESCLATSKTVAASRTPPCAPLNL